MSDKVVLQATLSIPSLPLKTGWADASGRAYFAVFPSPENRGGVRGGV